MHRHLLYPLAVVIVAVGCTNGGGVPQAVDGGADANIASALPTCTPPVVATLGGGVPSHVEGWSVRTRGTLTYDMDTDTPMDVSGTLVSIDSLASSLELAVSGGTLEVFIHPVSPGGLEALPIGHAVVAHFERGLILRDAADDSVLLAAVERHGTVRSPSFDVGPIHVDGGAPVCINLNACYETTIGAVQTQVTFTLGTATEVVGATVVPGSVLLTDGERSFAIGVVGSVRQASGDEVFAVTGRYPCAPALQTATAITIALVPSSH